MVAITFDTLKFVHRLRDAGIPEPQAEAIAEAFKDASGEAELATKGDISNIDRKIDILRSDMEKMELRMTHNLTLRLGAMLAAAVAVIAAIVRMPVH
ncbi:MAG: DUF1640 domain-containing protein [Alphaproteobacteria bacterium]